MIEKVDCRELAKELDVRTAAEKPRYLLAHCWNVAAHNNGDATPSMCIYPDGFKCYACGIHGDAIDLYRAVKPGSSFKRAKSAISAKHLERAPERSKDWEQLLLAHQKLSKLIPWGIGPGAEDWFRSRALSIGAAANFGVCSPPEGFWGLVCKNMNDDELWHAGLTDRFGTKWAPLNATSQDYILVPVRVHGVSYPVGWRARYFDYPLKEVAQPEATCYPLLRFGHESRLRLVVEGTPDFLAVLTYLHYYPLLEVNGRKVSALDIDVVGITAKAANFWRHINRLSPVNSTVFLLHGSPAHLGRITNSEKKLSIGIRENHDLNDMLKAGELVGFLDNIIGERIA